ncbi:acyl-CoA thioesterase [Kitasatospora sp. NPDC004289]
MTGTPCVSRTPEESMVTLAHIMSDHDTNLYGTVHGGVVMKLIDDAAAAAAGRHAGVPAVTVSVDGMSFLAPVRAGDLLTVRARLDHAGRTSMDVSVVVTAERWNISGPVTRVATAQLVFVAVDADGQPHRVPQLVTESTADRRRQRRARERRAARAGLVERGAG